MVSCVVRMEAHSAKGLFVCTGSMVAFIHLSLNQGLNVLHFYLHYLVGGGGCMPHHACGGQIATS